MNAFRTVVKFTFTATAIVWLGACEGAKAPTPPSGVPQPPTAPNPSITGFVREGVPLQTLGIADVLVQAEGGALDGQSTKTDSEGRFSFQGVGTSAMALKFTKTGYEVRRLEIPQGSQQTDVQLVALPPVARLDLRVDSIGSTHAIMGYSPIRFDATSSVAVRPTYLVEFGDGGSTSDATSVHPCIRAGSLTGRLTVADAFGRIAIATSRYDCVSLVTNASSRWIAADETARRGEAPREFTFRTQDGAMIAGYYRHPEGSLAAMTATLSGDRHIRITLNSGHMTFDGEVLLFAKQSSIRRDLALNVQGGPATGQLLRFYYYEYFGY